MKRCDRRAKTNWLVQLALTTLCVSILPAMLGCHQTGSDWHADAALAGNVGVLADGAELAPADCDALDSVGPTRSASTDLGGSSDIDAAQIADTTTGVTEPTTVWTTTIGGPSAKLSITDGVFDDLGNSYLTGCLSGTVNFGPIALTALAQSDPFVAVVSPQGSVLKAFTLESSGHSCAQAIIRSSTGKIFIAGNYRKDLAPTSVNGLKANSSTKDIVFVSEVDPQGIPLWFASGLELEGRAEGLAIDKNGSIYVTGGFAGQGTIGKEAISANDESDLFAAKLSPNGTALWGFVIHGGGNNDQGRSLITDSALNVYVVGAVKGPADHSAVPFMPAGGTQLVVAKIDALGQSQWFVHSEGANGSGRGNAVALTPAGDLIVAGSYGGPVQWGNATLPASSTGLSQALISKLASGTGNIVWSVRAESLQGLASAGEAVSVKSDGSFCVAGDFMGTALEYGPRVVSGATAANARSGFALGFDASGNPSWSVSAWGMSALAGPSFAAIDCSQGKELRLAGTMILESQFGESLQSARGVWDIFVWRLLLP